MRWASNLTFISIKSTEPLLAATPSGLGSPSHIRSPVAFQIAETYAFLPREAVTRFLMSCSDCQKRMHLPLNNESTGANATDSSRCPSPLLPALPDTRPFVTSNDAPPIIDFSMPLTNTFLNHWKKKDGHPTSAQHRITDDSYSYQADNEVRRCQNLITFLTSGMGQCLKHGVSIR